MLITLIMSSGNAIYAYNHVDPVTTIIAFCKIRYYVIQSTSMMYRWSLTAACFDRYALSSSNVRLRNFSRVYIARRVVIIIVLAWIVLPVHILLFHSIRNGICGPRYSIATALYHSIFTTITGCILPILFMSIFTLLTYRNLVLKQKRRQFIIRQKRDEINEVMNSQRIRDIQVLALLLTQVFLYIIATTPLMIWLFYNAITLTTTKSMNRLVIERFVGVMIELLVDCYPVLACYMYTMSSRTFRIELLKLCRLALHSCRTNNIEEVKKLFETITLEQIDQLKPNGSTALHAAYYHSHSEIVKLLLDAGADRSIHNKHQFLPFDEAKNDEIKQLFFRIPNNNRLVSSTGAIEWELIDDDVSDKAAEERQYIKYLYDNVAGVTTLPKMFEKIENNYINKVLINFKGIENIKRFFRKATEEQDPRWIIKAYTAETDFYKALNTEIACGATKAQNERRYIIALLYHHPILDQLAFIGNACRVIKINSDDLDKYQVDFDGTLIKSWIMCKYIIKHHRTALHIENISQYTSEGEILIMPYTVFKINKIKKVKPSYLPDGQSITEIQLEESH
ncbi:unnamed protein product [Adineta steineri]|uniref:G-protein coupled receptors family 1 profile domain-containing protein n=1 Tax=Adineta steineri TaxID=433720 RepID=A0A815K492_9BILA|nr:unnamed protein product [Adineta steineri]CAF1384935.1 unnamed protein product [Adineta steineri]CAF1567615.1 unnamed protein product [Adineta steineri]CAF1608865.1 unnamed protein product [Adineta steineri]